MGFFTPALNVTGAFLFSELKCSLLTKASPDTSPSSSPCPHLSERLPCFSFFRVLIPLLKKEKKKLFYVCVRRSIRNCSCRVTVALQQCLALGNLSVRIFDEWSSHCAKFWCLMVASEHCYGSITEELRGSLTHKWWSGTLLCDRIYPECEKYESKHSRQQSCPQLGYYSAIGPLGWRRQWHPTPVFLPGESHGWRSLEGCSPWGP